MTAPHPLKKYTWRDPMTLERARELLTLHPRLLHYGVCDHGEPQNSGAAAEGRRAFELLARLQRPGSRGFVDSPSVMGARQDYGLHPDHAALLIAAPELARAYVEASERVLVLEAENAALRAQAAAEAGVRSALIEVLSACELQQTDYPEWIPYMKLSMPDFERARVALAQPPEVQP